MKQHPPLLPTPPLLAHTQHFNDRQMSSVQMSNSDFYANERTIPHSSWLPLWQHDRRRTELHPVMSEFDCNTVIALLYEYNITNSTLEAVLQQYDAVPESCFARRAPLTAADETFLFTAKMVLIPVIAIATLLASLLPWVFARLEGAILYMTFSACLTAGVIVGAGFTHILPDAVDAWTTYACLHGDHDDSLYPYAEMIGVAVLLLLFSIDRSCIRHGIGGDDGSDGGHSGHSHAVPTLPSTKKHNYGATVEIADLSPTSAPPTPTSATLHAHDGNANGNGHAHAHADNGDSEKLKLVSAPDENALKRGTAEQVSTAYLFLAALALHSIFDGASIGAEDSVQGFYALLFAVASHKLLDGFALGVPVYYAKLGTVHTAVALGLSALMTPIGIGQSRSQVSSYPLGHSLTFLYVRFV